MRELSVKQAMTGKPEEIPHNADQKKRKYLPGMRQVLDLVQRLHFFPFLGFFLTKISAFEGKEELKCP